MVRCPGSPSGVVNGTPTKIGISPPGITLATELSWADRSALRSAPLVGTDATRAATARLAWRCANVSSFSSGKGILSVIVSSPSDVAKAAFECIEPAAQMRAFARGSGMGLQQPVGEGREDSEPFRDAGNDHALGAERCGHALVATDPGARCPECGVSVDESRPELRPGVPWQRGASIEIRAPPVGCGNASRQACSGYG